MSFHDPDLSSTVSQLRDDLADAKSQLAVISITYRWEPFQDMIGEALPMLRAYFDESQLFPQLAMEPDLATFFELARLGRFRVFCCRRDGILIGVNSFMVGGTLLRLNCPQAWGFILALSPAERLGWTGYKLLKLPEDDFREWGIKLVGYTPSSKSTDIGPLLTRLGYTRAQASYEKML